MKHSIKITCLAMAVLAALFASASCKRLPISMGKSEYRLDIITDSSELYNKAKPYELYTLYMYDKNTHKQVFKMITGPKGGYIYYSQAGTYDMILLGGYYGETTVERIDDYNIAYITTPTVQTSPTTVISQPYNLYLASGELDLPHITSDDEYTIPVTVKSPMDNWRVLVTGIEGLEYARSIFIYLSGQYRNYNIGKKKSSGECILYAPGVVSEDNSIIDTPITTFGMIPDRTVSLQISIMGGNGAVHKWVGDVSDVVNDTENIDHIISLHWEIKLEPYTQGGLDPSTEEWVPIVEIIDIK